MEISEEWGYFLVLKKWKFQGGWGDLHEILSMVGVWMFSGTTQYKGKVELIFGCSSTLSSEILARYETCCLPYKFCSYFIFSFQFFLLCFSWKKNLNQVYYRKWQHINQDTLLTSKTPYLKYDYCNSTMP